MFNIPKYQDKMTHHLSLHVISKDQRLLPIIANVWGKYILPMLLKAIASPDWFGSVA